MNFVANTATGMSTRTPTRSTHSARLKKSHHTRTATPPPKTPPKTAYTAVTELPNLAPGGAVSKRAWGDPVGDSDTLALDLDCFHEAANDLAAGLKAGLVETSANLVGEVLQLRDNQSQFLAAGRQICCRHSFLL